jgi:alkyldihydroxyacetonephosphate synthase
LNLAEGLGGVLDADRISYASEDLAAHSLDHLPRSWIERRAGRPPRPPAAVIRPVSTDEVAAVLAWADSTRTPVVPFGGGSGVCGALAPEGAVVIDTGALDSIGEVDDKSLLVTAGAGVIGSDLDSALAEGGFLLGHEPQSVAISTVGGWIATRACGQLSARFGAIEDLVAGLEAVLPGGRIVRTKSAPRRSVGPDLTGLLFGSEGTIGVVTEATLRLSPRPDERVDRCVRFDHMTDGVTACRRLAQSELHPTLVRLYDADDAGIFLRHFADRAVTPFLLLSFDGFEAERRAAAALELAGGSPGEEDLVAHWWSHRNDAVDDYRRLMAGEGMLSHGVVDTIEVAGTWTVLRDLYHSIKEALSQHAQIAGCHLSHIYRDGACLYFTMVSMCESDDEALETNGRWWEAAMSACLAAGGTISHHHGIGRARARWLPDELGEWYEVLKSVKRALDPNGIMNPGGLGLG